MYRDSETGVVFHHGMMTRSPLVPRIIQVVSFLFGILYLLLGIRFVLEYVSARHVAFVDFIDRCSEPFYRPFQGIVANGRDAAGHPLVWSILVALAAYVLLHALIVGLLRMTARTRIED
jgi:uncharacterized protein YggT (Ycf19 family)